MRYSNHKFKQPFIKITGMALLLFCAVFQYPKAQTANNNNNIDPIKLELFPLNKVQLLDSPFKKAMELDGEYLMKLDPDRLLAPYLKELGLEPKGENYGGWEDNGVMGEGLDGHSLGHYLSALSMIYASTGKQKFKDRISYIIDELQCAQEANDTGYVGGVPNGEKILNEVEHGKINAEPFSLNGSWVPWYNLHKTFAGLRDAYRHAGSEQALDILIKLSDWAVEFSNHLTDQQFQKMLQTEQGGMKEVMADIYGITGDKKYLELTKRFTHHAVMDPLAKNEDKLQGLHANTQIPKIIGAARQYEVSGDKEMKNVASYFWQTVVNGRTYVNGGNSDHEHFGERGKLAQRLSRSTSETCNTYNMLKLTRHLTQWEANPAYADYYERALYNHILASQDPQTGMFAYYMSMEEGFYKTFSKPFDSFWCCVGTGMENHTKYGRYIYMHTDDELYVNLFIPSEVNWNSQDVRVIQKTEFPESEKSTFIIETDQPKDFALKMRRPYWAGDGYSIKVNGKPVEVNQKPSSYITIDRGWKDGDTVTVSLPMKTRIETMPNDDSKLAFMHGPLLLAGIVGQQLPIPGQYASDQWKFFDLPSVHVPALDPKKDSINKWVKPIKGEKLKFELTQVGEADGIPLAPYYMVNHDYYTIYWDLKTEN